MSSNYFQISLLLWCMVCCTSSAQIPAFPGAEGFGALASGGRGGKVLYVTNLNADGPGSLQAAINENGKRYILFKVSGTIPTTIEVPPGHGDFTLAGQTSPSGIIVRGFLSYNEENPSSGNFIIRHLRSRIGDRETYPSPYWIAEDGITLGGVHNAIIDHCSFGQASDEAVDISRSSSLTIQHCLLSETLGGHSYLGGMLINYTSSQSRLDSLTIHHNVWNRIGGRMPEISCESDACNGRTIKLELSNNLAWDPRIELWYEGPSGGGGHFFLHMNAVNNLYHAGRQFSNAMYHHDLLHFQQNQLYFSGNVMNLYADYSDYDLFYCCNDFDLYHPNTDMGIAQRINLRHAFPAIRYTPVSQLKSLLAQSTGAFPRDAMDFRLFSSINNDQIDPLPIEEDHYHDGFNIQNDKTPPADTDSDGMPDYWETFHGLDPGTQDHNGTSLSQKIYGIPGYTNLECYLNCLSDALISGQGSGSCGIRLGETTETVTSEDRPDQVIYPNPATGFITIRLPHDRRYATLEILDMTGKTVVSCMVNSGDTVSVSDLPAGLYSAGIGIPGDQIRWTRLVIIQ